ncbi:hypothetical protein VTO42DRAFT_1151 [Malbranchea cinnamomea]
MARIPDDISDMSSELSSIGSTPPPSPYPSPSSQSRVGCSSVNSFPSNPETPKKKRKVEPKPRKTRYLDLTLPASGPDLDLMLKTLRKKRKIVVIAGAGISVSAGIPDFRSSNGLFSTLRKDHKLKASGKQLFDISVYQEESTTSSFHDMVRSLSSMAQKAKPTLFHHLLARLAKEGRLRRLYTQNVDEIDTSLPPLATEVPLGVKAPWPRTIQLHGGLKKMVCQKCRHTSDLQPEKFQGPYPPSCEKCHENEMARTTTGQRSHGVGKLRPRIVLYNEHNPDEEAIGSVVTADLRSRPDCLIVVGTSLKIPGVRRIVKEMSRVVRGRRDGITMWINRDSLPVGKEFENCWDLIVKSDSDEVARLAGFKRWDDDSDDICDVTGSEAERIKQQSKPSVVIRTPSKRGQHNTGLLTRSAVDNDSTPMPVDGPAIPMKPLKNPASAGLSISDLLGREANQAGSGPKSCNRSVPNKPSQRKKQSISAAKDQSGKINQNFRVTKSAKPIATKGNKPQTTKNDIESKARGTKSKTTKDETPSNPMCPLSPGSARSNGPAVTEFSEECSNTSPFSHAWEDKRTVFPTCRSPRGFESLIDTEMGNP